VTEGCVFAHQIGFFVLDTYNAHFGDVNKMSVIAVIEVDSDVQTGGLPLSSVPLGASSLLNSVMSCEITNGKIL
jgi:hypothetical protein